MLPVSDTHVTGYSRIHRLPFQCIIERSKHSMLCLVSTRSYPDLGPIQLLIHIALGAISYGIKGSDHEGDGSTPPRAQIKNDRNCTIATAYLVVV